MIPSGSQQPHLQMVLFGDNQEVLAVQSPLCLRGARLETLANVGGAWPATTHTLP